MSEETQANGPLKELEEKQPRQITQLPFSLVKKHNNKTTKLLANSDAAVPLDGQNRWYSYEFKTPVFIYRIVVHATNYPDYREFEIEAKLENGSISGRERGLNPGRFYCS